MTEELARLVARLAPQDKPVFTVEDGGIWLSGMNANLKLLHYRVVGHLREHDDYEVGETSSEDGGYYVEVPVAEEIHPDELDAVLEEVAADG